MKFGNVQCLGQTIDYQNSLNISRRIVGAVQSGPHPRGVWGYSNFPGRRIDTNAAKPLCIQIDRENEHSRIAAGNEIGDSIDYDKPWWYYFTGRSPENKKKQWSLAYIRLWPELIWHWNDEPISQLLKELLNPVEHLFEKVTRVSVIIQMVGRAVPVHRDLVPGYWYQNITSPTDPEPGCYQGYFRGRPHKVIDHQEIPNSNFGVRHGYMGLRIPLSLGPENSVGNPYVFIDNQKHYYNCKNHYFLLNEATLHGADVCPYERGVVSISGIFNIDKLEREPKSPPLFSLQRFC